MANPILSDLMIADFFRTFTQQEYCLESAHVENTSGAAITLKGLPYPVKAGSGAGFVEVMTALESATPANIVGYLVTNRTEELAATTGVSMAQYAYLARGEAVVDTDNYVAADPHAGAAYDAADFNTFNAAANPPIIGRANAGLESALDRS